MKKKINRFIKRILITIKKPEMNILPGQLAYFFVLSLVPILSLIGVIASLFGLSINKIIEFLNTSFGVQISYALEGFVQGKGFDFQMAILFIAAFLIASNGSRSIIVSSNLLYNIKSQNGLRLQIKSILLTFVIVFLFLFILVVPAFGSYILKFLGEINVSSNVIGDLYEFFNLLRWPISYLFIYFNIKLIYTMAPDSEVKSKDVTYGAVFTTTVWIIATWIFSYYVSHFAKYDIFYGSLSNIVAIMFWMYMLSYVFVLGMALNVSKNDLDKTLTKIF
ncbi:MAG: YihY/virulence factor BrkB family protein [Bacilli bacterium]|nr:YihY/virulence factor BrkB family protein [Bacilli bacterium]